MSIGSSFLPIPIVHTFMEQNGKIVENTHSFSFVRITDAGPLDVNQEVDKYLTDSSDTLMSLDSYPHLRQLCQLYIIIFSSFIGSQTVQHKHILVLNTGLPSSAAVERLFSLGGRVFSPLRSKLTSEHFEMLTFLRLAKW